MCEHAWDHLEDSVPGLLAEAECFDLMSQYHLSSHTLLAVVDQGFSVCQYGWNHLEDRDLGIADEAVCTDPVRQYHLSSQIVAVWRHVGSS